MLKLRIIGINSGTSMDAIDLSLVEFIQDGTFDRLLPPDFSSIPLHDPFADCASVSISVVE